MHRRQVYVRQDFCFLQILPLLGRDFNSTEMSEKCAKCLEGLKAVVLGGIVHYYDLLYHNLYVSPRARRLPATERSVVSYLQTFFWYHDFNCLRNSVQSDHGVTSKRYETGSVLKGRRNSCIKCPESAKKPDRLATSCTEYMDGTKQLEDGNKL